MSALAASALGLAQLGRHPWIFHPLSRTERTLSEISFLACLAGLASLVALAASGPPRPSPTVLIAATLHLVSLTWLLSRLPMPPGLRPWLLVALVWWIPVLIVDQHGAIGPLGRFLLGPAGSPGQETQTQTWGAVDMAPTVAFGLTGWLLTPPLPRA